MCEYCKNFKGNNFKSLIHNVVMDSSLFIDSKQGRLFWRINGFHGGTLIAYAKINYCPMCGRKFEPNKE